MSHVALRLDVSRKQFGDHTVLADLSLELRDEQVVSLVGPSGCGKSTLLRIIAGLDPHYEGNLELAGDHQGAPAIGVVFQEPRLLPWCTVLENVGFGSRDMQRDRPLILQLLREVGLHGHENKLPKALSGGMAQRVAIARALFSVESGTSQAVAQRRLLLLDEPFSAVDAFTRIRLHELLLSLIRQHRLTVLMVTHDMDEAVYLSDHILVLGTGPGRILQTLPVKEPHPRARESARLTGLKQEILHCLTAGRAF